LKIRLLGTGTSQGVPILGCDCKVCLSSDSNDKRLRTSALVSENNHHLVIDCGPDFRQQMLAAQVHTLDSILLTHEHNDHIIGLDDIRPYNFRSGKPMDIYGKEEVLTELSMRFPYVFNTLNKYPGAPEVKKNIITKNVPFQWGEKYILPIFSSIYASIGRFRLPDFRCPTTSFPLFSFQCRRRFTGYRNTKA